VFAAWREYLFFISLVMLFCVFVSWREYLFFISLVMFSLCLCGLARIPVFYLFGNAFCFPGAFVAW
ncbi:MAG TPA: hypothetical protein PL181_16785, partial [bacterium]|nr:hypothetical protein [bacterium]